MEVITIRLAVVSDAFELIEINKEFNGHALPVADVSASLSVSRELVAVALVDGKLAGFACAQLFKSFCYKQCHGEITEMYMRQAYRRKGIATALIAMLEVKLKEQGAEGIKILTNAQNIGAIRLYETAGYKRQTETVMFKHINTSGTIDI